MVQYREGDIIIGVLARVHNRVKSAATCNRILGDGIEEIETVNMLIDMVSSVFAAYTVYYKYWQSNILRSICLLDN